MVDERTPLAGTSTSLMGTQVTRNMFLAAMVICLSAGLLNFNRWLMDKARFPYAVPLLMIHMAFCSAFSCLLFVCMPSMFPSLRGANSLAIDMRFLARKCAPISLTFATSLLLNQISYSNLPLAFMQMIKESNLVWIYAISLLVATERFEWRQAQVIAVACCALMMSVEGELHFEFSAFVLQFVAVLCDAGRIVMQSIILSKEKLDAMSYVLLISPMTCALLSALFVVLACLPAGVDAGNALAMPTGALLRHWAPVLLASCLVSFGLNVSIALLIKQVSPTSYAMCGIIKDVLVVSCSALFVRESISLVQVFAFAVQVSCVLAWSVLKSTGTFAVPGGQQTLALALDKQQGADVVEQAPEAGAGPVGKEKV